MGQYRIGADRSKAKSRRLEQGFGTLQRTRADGTRVKLEHVGIGGQHQLKA